jgi:hypothetical protein
MQNYLKRTVTFMGIVLDFKKRRKSFATITTKENSSMEENEVVSEPVVDGSFVETSFGRSDFAPEDEEELKRVYRDKASAKAMGVDAKAVRAWAKERGLVTSNKGKMSSQVIARYKQEQGN